ncbi:MAG TPA: hypothetical protein DDZ80_09010 [Cyanobacteria bacterium UBA8803]|nr:hypothetical protein [Cyanobacteria bacterium UBA8803]
MASNKQKNQLWASIDSIETAKQAAQQGVWAAAFVAIITSIFAIVSVALGGSLPEGMPAIDAWAFWDVGIFVAIAWGIHKMSRFAAVAGLVLYIVEQIIMRISNPSNFGAGLFIVILFILAFINAVRGTFAYHRFRRAN